MDKNYKILAVNLGSTSSKIGAWDNEKPTFVESLSHPREELAPFPSVWDQYPYRMKALEELLTAKGLRLEEFDVFVSRGGNVRPVPGGIYAISTKLLADMRSGRYGTHPTGVGNLIAYNLGQKYNKPAIFVDAPVTDEFCPEARVTGIPEITRQSSFHALNQKATARKIAADLGKRYDEVNLIICHLGGGISVGTHRRGQVIDVNNALDGDGPMSPERAGAVPTGYLVDMCYSGLYTREEMRKKLTGKGGWIAHLGTADGRELLQRIKEGDAKAAAIFQATLYQIAKEIGAMATVLEGDCDGIGFTGSLAYAPEIVEGIKRRTAFLKFPYFLYPGENEMEALCAGALRYLRGTEAPKPY